MEKKTVLTKGEKLAIGVDLGGTNIKFALIDDKGKIHNKIELPTEAHQGWKKVLNRIHQGIHELINEFNLKISELKGIGIGVPGLPDFNRGEVLWGPNIGWQNVPAGSWLRERLGIPVYIDNDANAAAYGEFWVGGGKGTKNMIAVTIGTGIGAGLILEGKVFRGSSGAAGELGHIIILPEGPQCNCGRRGCLETLTAAPAIVKAAILAVEEGRDTSLANLRGIQAKDVFVAANTGDKVAKEIIDRVAYYLGIGLANAINLLNPDLILIGGGVSRGGKLIMEPLKKYTLENSLPTSAKEVNIDFAQLGNDAGAVGAAGIVFAETQRNTEDIEGTEKH